jgi:hypothetical protein
VLNLIPPQIRQESLRSLYKLCGHHALLPRSLNVLKYSHTTEFPSYFGGSADVWEGVSLGEKVAVKVLRLSMADDLTRTVHVSYQRCV